MAQKRGSRKVKGRFDLVSRTETEEVPPLRLTVLDEAGEALETVDVDDDGAFEVAESVLEGAAEVSIGPADRPGAAKRLPVEVFRADIERGVVALAPGRWRAWLWWTRCVTGEVRRCFPKPWVLASLLPQTVSPPPSLPNELAELAPVEPSLTFLWPCSPVCKGVVEVYRRRCCCPDIVVYDPRIPEIVERVPEPPFPIPIPEPDPPIPFPPGPDPVPWDLLDAVTTRGAVDAYKVQAEHDVAVLADLDPEAQVAFLNARRYLWCTCGPPTKVGEGSLQDDGSFDVCWSELPTLSPTWCHDEFAYVVKQPRFGSMVTIYDGVAAHQWFDAGDHPTLTSYSPLAVGCRESSVPTDGAFVILQDIGDTPSHRLQKPPQDGVFSVGSLSYNSGLLDPAAAAHTATLDQDRNLGGRLRLRYEFTDGMHDLGAVYYRVSLAPADPATGDPTGPFQPLPAPPWRYWRIPAGTDGLHALGPHTVGGESDLYVIPFDGVAPLDANDQWHDGQYHASVDTTGKPDGRYLVAVEVFDAAGDRLRPQGSTGTGNEEPFTFRRWESPGTTSAVPYAALTHMLWWNNQKATASIVDIRKNGTPSSANCQFIEGGAADTISVGYRAYHPRPASGPTQPRFVRNHSLALHRGLNPPPPAWRIEQDSGENVGGPGAVAPQQSDALPLSTLLGPPPAGGVEKCSFALRLHVRTKTTTGEGFVTATWDQATAAFAAEVT